ncbi:uncharacterized protein SCHCODRAFT_02639203 [Schizophyllum commune H4-8]|uniref:uncharacterized protein n=1 Tax=Schizophyllum commune (strain H4-8 / FGSC 9210) TaxID=578458 RepID=UPI00215F3F60|nr:uncharacterized protein SCHCODRAFT_02639203 [Schizophyllum commune H4-8]KAI5887910.1 hypothetical protein SCHCODRAFT_02639203 [Schizophyllum commune H4-8]
MKATMMKLVALALMAVVAVSAQDDTFETNAPADTTDLMPTATDMPIVSVTDTVVTDSTTTETETETSDSESSSKASSRSSRASSASSSGSKSGSSSTTRVSTTATRTTTSETAVVTHKDPFEDGDDSNGAMGFDARTGLVVGAVAGVMGFML